MAATSIKLLGDPKSRIAPLAEAAGLSPHAWMLHALAVEADRAGRKGAFVAEGRARLKELRGGAPTYAADDAFDYLS